jgi:thioredoxin reductase (NADPH)
MSEGQRPLDALVVGGGIAGLTAASVLAERGYSVTIADEMCAGGRLLNLGPLRAYPGLDAGLTGPELAGRCLEAAMDLGVAMLPARVLRLEQGELWRAETTDGSVEARAVVLATGRDPDVVAVPGAEAFAGRGVSHCAGCDGPLFSGQPVAVAGTGWWLPTDVEQLAAIAETVTVVLPGDRPGGPGRSWERIADMPNVQIIMHARLTGLEGGLQGLEALVVDRAGTGEQRFAASALFLSDDDPPAVPGGVPAELLDGSGAIRTRDDASTTLPGLFGAGTVRAGSLPYLVAAAGDGVRAAVSAGAYLDIIESGG